MKRDETIDIAKGIGIILVVIGHCAVSDSQQLMRNFIYMFHIPLFFFLSGYFFKIDYTEKKVLFVKRKIKGLWWPYVKWSLLFLVLHNVFLHLHIISPNVTHYYTFQEFIRRGASALWFSQGEYLLGPFWFIGNLFFAALYVLIGTFLIKISKLDKYFTSFLFLVGLFLLFSIISSIYDLSDWHLRPKYFLAAAIFVCGHLSHRYSFFKYNKITYVIFAIVILFAATIIHYAALGELEFWYDAPYILIMGVIGSWMTILISRWLVNTKAKSLLVYIGENTMWVLALHLLAFELVNIIKISYYDLDILYLAACPIPMHNNWLFFLLYILVGVGVPISLKYIYDKGKCKINNINFTK